MSARNPRGIKVRRNYSIRGTFASGYGIAECWRVYENGSPLPYLVVRGTPPAPFLTLVTEAEPRTMLTCWHAGIRPGDLARRYTPEGAPV